MGKIDLSNAKFGDVFRTRGGEKAILICRERDYFTDGHCYEFISATHLGAYSHYRTDVNGRAYVSVDWKEREHDCDIVELWEK